MQVNQTRGFGVNLMRLIYIMNDPAMGVKLINDKVFTYF